MIAEGDNGFIDIFRFINGNPVTVLYSGGNRDKRSGSVLFVIHEYAGNVVAFGNSLLYVTRTSKFGSLLCRLMS